LDGKLKVGLNFDVFRPNQKQMRFMHRLLWCRKIM